MLISKAEIARLIPHAGSMCLLDGVLAWDATKIKCFSRTHSAATNPLRMGEQLPALCGIEYAAQAMAVHGGLSGSVGSQPRAGYLASLREVICHVARLDNLMGDLIVEAEQLMGDETHVIYQFAVQVGAIAVLTGRAAVVLDAGVLDAGVRA